MASGCGANFPAESSVEEANLRSRKQADIEVCPRFVSERDLAVISGLRVRTLQQFRLRDIGPPFHKLNGSAIRYDLREFELLGEGSAIGRRARSRQ